MAYLSVCFIKQQFLLKIETLTQYNVHKKTLKLQNQTGMIPDKKKSTSESSE